jgi:enoyl-CoA hydratase/carnithine racemase
VDNIPRLLKAFVIAGGIALLGGTALLLALLVLRATGSPVAGQPEVTIALPPGGRIEQVVPDGQRWLLLGSDAAGQQFLAVIDARSGERLGLVWLQPAP